MESEGLAHSYGAGQSTAVPGISKASAAISAGTGDGDICAAWQASAEGCTGTNSGDSGILLARSSSTRIGGNSQESVSHTKILRSQPTTLGDLHHTFSQGCRLTFP